MKHYFCRRTSLRPRHPPRCAEAQIRKRPRTLFYLRPIPCLYSIRFSLIALLSFSTNMCSVLSGADRSCRFSKNLTAPQVHALARTGMIWYHTFIQMNSEDFTTWEGGWARRRGEEWQGGLSRDSHLFLRRGPMMKPSFNSTTFIPQNSHIWNSKLPPLYYMCPAECEVLQCQRYRFCPRQFVKLSLPSNLADNFNLLRILDSYSFIKRSIS